MVVGSRFMDVLRYTELDATMKEKLGDTADGTATSNELESTVDCAFEIVGLKITDVDSWSVDDVKLEYESLKTAAVTALESDGAEVTTTAVVSLL